jgi:sugar phosphate permease
MSDIEKKASLDAVDASHPAADQLEHVQTKEGGQHTFIRPSAQEEAAVIRKLDWRLLPIVFILYSLAVLDRSNLGNARLAGMEDDIDLSGDRYNLLGTVFYIAYIFSQ